MESLKWVSSWGRSDPFVIGQGCYMIFSSPFETRIYKPDPYMSWTLEVRLGLSQPVGQDYLFKDNFQKNLLYELITYVHAILQHLILVLPGTCILGDMNSKLDLICSRYISSKWIHMYLQQIDKSREVASLLSRSPLSHLARVFEKHHIRDMYLAYLASQIYVNHTRFFYYYY